MSLNGFFFKQWKIFNAVEIDKYNFLYKHHKADMNGKIFFAFKYDSIIWIFGLTERDTCGLC